MARFPHAGNHNTARDTREQTNGTHKTIIQNIGQRAERIRFQSQHAAAFGQVWVMGKVIHVTFYAATAFKGQ
jgi:hypothetical protein